MSAVVLEHSPGLCETTMMFIPSAVPLSENITNPHSRRYFLMKVSIWHVPRNKALLCFSKKDLLFCRPIEDPFNIKSNNVCQRCSALKWFMISKEAFTDTTKKAILLNFRGSSCEKGMMSKRSRRKYPFAIVTHRG